MIPHTQELGGFFGKKKSRDLLKNMHKTVNNTYFLLITLAKISTC